MTIRKRESRDGKSRLFIEIRYRTADGRSMRFRRDASVQTRTAALAEERRLLAELERTGTLERVPTSSAEDSKEPEPVTFSEAVRHFRGTHMKTLKPSTRITYNERLDRVLLPRFGEVKLPELDGEKLQALDAKLLNDEIAASGRRNIQIIIRSVLRTAVEAGLLEQMPKMPKLPRVERKAPNPLHRDDVDAILAIASPSARLAFALAAFAGLRRSEVVGLRWSDVDLKGNVITVRRAITRGEETTPKSGKPRAIPIAVPLRAILEPLASKKKTPWSSVATTTAGKLWGEFGLNQAFQ